jgi:hypothetical protein
MTSGDVVDVTIRNSEGGLVEGEREVAGWRKGAVTEVEFWF